MSRRPGVGAVSLVVIIAAVMLSGCGGLAVQSSGAVPLPEATDTPYVVYVTPTPEGYVAPTSTPNVVYVTATLKAAPSRRSRHTSSISRPHRPPSAPIMQRRPQGWRCPAAPRLI